MSQQHTPGPWRHGRNKVMGRVDGKARLVDAPGWFIGPARGVDIAAVHCTASQKAAEQEANARLMSAAPDLLNACKLAIAFGSQGDTHEGLSVSEFLRAAVAKAEGGN